jgi:TonB-linked SusC/RagA family outer membrane protein
MSPRCIILFVIILIGGGLKGQGILHKKITIDARDSQIKSVLSQIENQASVRFTYIPSLIDAGRRVTIQVRRSELGDVLREIFNSEVEIIAMENEREIVLSPAPRTAVPRDDHSLLLTVSGSVTDVNEQPLPGVNIIEKGTTKGTTTDVNGNFTFRVDENAVLIFSFIGFVSQEVAVGKRNVIQVRLAQDLKTLQEIVVVGFGEQKRTTVTGAISSVRSEELLGSPTANVSNALVGRMSGLLAKQISSEPGADEPLIRIRGIGTFSGSQEPLIMVDGVRVDNFSNLDPAEIETISILKDASSTAVYGVRGANGVLLITTKRGEKGKPVFDFSSNVAFTQIIDIRKYSDSYSWAKGFNQARQYDSYVTRSPYEPRWSEMDLELFKSGSDPVFHPNTDWIDLMMKPVAMQTYNNLNVSGGIDRLKYFISLGSFSQGGLFDERVMNPDYSSQIRFKRYNFRSNLDFEVTKQFSIKLNLSAQIEQRRGPGVGADSGNGTGQIIANMERVPPVMSPGWVDGKVVNVYDFFGGNPLQRLLAAGVNDRYDNSLNSMIRLDHKLDFLVKGLTAHATISYKNFDTQLRIHRKDIVVYTAKKLPDGSINLVPQGLEGAYNFTESGNTGTASYAEFGLDLARVFGDHTVTGLFYYNQEKTMRPDLEFLVPHGYQGLVSRATYDYKGRYLAEVNIGYNGTENFAEHHRFGLFPAYSAGWVVSQEPFFPRNNFLSFVKVRASAGTVGNDQIGASRFLYRQSSYVYGQFGNYYHFGHYASDYNRVIGSSEGLIGNADLTWERAKKINVGTDLTMLNDKVTIALDLFREKRSDILARKNTLPTIFGANRPGFDFAQQNGYWLPAFNIGKMVNSGFDGEIAFNQRVASQLGYWVKANYTYAHNRILFQDEVPKKYPYQYREGQRYGQMYGFVAEGFYNSWDEVNDEKRPVSLWNNDRIQPGDVRYKDINGDGRIDVYDLVPLGYSDFPETIFGISFGARFLGFYCSALFQGATNVSIRYSKRTMQGWENEGGTLQQIIDNSWTYERQQAGMTSIYPRPSAMLGGHNAQSSSLNITDASYVRLKNVEIGYSLAPGVLEKIGIASGRMFLSASNLVTWSGVLPGEDPENPAMGDLETYPLTMTVNLGINVTF